MYRVSLTEQDNQWHTWYILRIQLCLVAYIFGGDVRKFMLCVKLAHDIFTHLHELVDNEEAEIEEVDYWAVFAVSCYMQRSCVVTLKQLALEGVALSKLGQHTQAVHSFLVHVGHRD